MTVTEKRAEHLMALLAEPALDDQHRARSVEELLELGYPYALQIHPDDLAVYRRRAKARTRVLVGLTVAVLLVVMALFGVIKAVTPDEAAAASEGRRALSKCYRNIELLSDENFARFAQGERARIGDQNFEQILWALRTSDAQSTAYLCAKFR